MDKDMDSSVIGESLKEEILAEVKEEIASGVCQELTTIWAELWDETEQNKRRGILASECKKEIKEFLQEVLKNEKKVRDDYIARIEELLNEMNTLQKVLEIAIPYEDVETLPLHIMAARLNKKAEKYRMMKNERIQKLNELIEKEISLCDKLGMVRQKIDPSEVPTKAKLILLENHIAVMEQEKVNRTFTFLEQKQVIIKLFEELGIQPLLNFEKKLLTEEVVEEFALTNENMMELDKLRNDLEKQLENAKERANDLKEKLMLLWNYLGESEEYKKEFLQKHVGCTSSTISSLVEELGKCETKKKENMSTIVERIRQVLVEEWDRCLIGQEEREKFRPFYINCFTEDLCDLHELEIKRLRDYFRDNEQIFQLVQKHDKLFNKLLELESGSKNANRYYNRGGQLLQEEKERKLITKELPIVEEELRGLLKKYKEDHSEAFTAFGVSMEDILDEKWSAHFDQKTIEKLSRKKGDKKRTPLGKRVCTTPYTPMSANKISRLNPQHVVSATKSATPKPPRRNIKVQKKLNEDKEPTNTLVLNDSYEEFQSGLQAKLENSAKSKKPAVRSTAINDNTPGILRERNTPNRIRPMTPVKTTPAKLSTPMWSPSVMKSPKTVPRTRKPNDRVRLMPARSRLPIII
ncbi:hypothetical protein RUM44_000457 [Polyplax serrata]|uniref:Protein regulator of cytokinesis 1 n=1 Tax=Polyplax serrata TaxID=468196 RepID=A0ABR1B5J1_POLSC